MTEQDELARLNAELQTYKQAFPTCDKHKPSGSRGGCLVCGMIQLNAVLSQISYECGEPNEYHLSAYDMDYDEQQVIKQVTTLKAENAALRKCVELYADS